MGYYDRCVKVPKNKIKACAFCVLLCLANLIDISEARKVALGRVTKPTANRGYASPDIAKLSYSPNHSAVPAKTAPAPAQQPPIGWNVHNNNNGAPPPYSAASNHGPPPPYSAQPNPNVNSRFNEPPPPYSQSNPGFPPAPNYQSGQAAGFGAPSGVVAGNAYRPHGHNVSGVGGFGGGFAPVPNAGYPVQPAQGFPGAPVAQPGGGYPGGYQPGGFQPGGYPQQPGYQPPAGGFQQPGTIIHHYEQPSSGGSGIGTVLGAGVVGLAAGAGGAALYDALKPKEEAKEAAVDATTTTTTTTTTTLAPINPNGDAPLAPLVPLPETPNGEAPLAPMPVVPPNPNGDAPLAAMPAAETTTIDAASTAETTTTENPLGIAPLAAFPVAENGASNTTSAETSSTPVSTVAVEAPNAALNAQPNQAAPVGPATASQNSDSAVGKAQLSTLALLVPVICRLFL